MNTVSHIRSLGQQRDGRAGQTARLNEACGRCVSGLAVTSAALRVSGAATLSVPCDARQWDHRGHPRRTHALSRILDSSRSPQIMVRLWAALHAVRGESQEHMEYR